jgi:hypothetical protein
MPDSARLVSRLTPPPLYPHRMCAVRFRSITPPLRPLPPTPPHPLQASLPGIAPDTFEADTYTVHIGRSPPATPPPSPSVPQFSIPESLSYISHDSLQDSSPNDMSQWDQLLVHSSGGQSRGRRAYDYIPFTAIAPHYLRSNTRTPAWILEQVRGEIPSDLIKLKPGSAICVQDNTLQRAYQAPSAPVMMGVIDHM